MRVAAQRSAAYALERGTPVRPLELAAAAIVFAALAWIAFGGHVLHGGLYYDDWSYSALYQFNEPGFFGAIRDFWTITSQRPLLTIVMPLQHAVFGESAALHHLGSLVFAIWLSLSVYVVTRILGIERLHAMVIGMLLLIFPFADVTKLWPTSSVILMAIALYMTGLAFALTALRREGRTALPGHVVSLVLYTLALLSYELVAGAICASVSCYLLRGSLRRSLKRWAIDLVLVAAILFAITSRTSQEVQETSVVIEHARLMLDQGLSVLVLGVFPVGGVGRGLIIAAVAAVALAAVLAWAFLPSHDGRRDQLRRWLLAFVIGVIAIAAGYVMFIPADLYYTPLQPGLGNRVNAFAAVGIVVVAYATVMLLATLVLLTVRPGVRRVAVPAMALVCGLLLCLEYGQRVRLDVFHWREAAKAQDRVLDAIQRNVPALRDGATVYVFGAPGFVAPGVPVFAATWDLNGAIKVERDNGTLTASPIVAGPGAVAAPPGVICERDAPRPADGGMGSYASGAPSPARYRHTYFVDVPGDRAVRVDSRRECRTHAARWSPGVFEEGWR